MNTPKNKSFAAFLRITLSIMLKDIVDAIKNKNVLTALFTSLFMIVMYRALPILENKSELPLFFIYDEGNSSLTAYLENSADVEIRTYTSLEAMQEGLGNRDIPVIGLFIPDEFDESLEINNPGEIKAYVVNWVTEKQALELKGFAETEISSLLGQEINIDLQTDRVFLSPLSGGLGVSAGLSLGFVIVMNGLILIPHLMLEEKKKHTLEVLLISPATPLNVAIAKALAGLFYCFLGAAVGVIFNYTLIVHWGLFGLSVLLGAVFTVCLGLLLGTMINDRAQLTLLSWLFILPLFLPMFLSLMKDLFPVSWVAIMDYFPTSVMFYLMRNSFAGVYDLGKVILYTGILLVYITTALIALVWLVRRQSRQEKFSSLKAKDMPARTESKPVSQSKPIDTSKVSASKYIHLNSGQESVQLKRWQSLRIISAIAAKDIRDAFRNRILLSIFLGVLLLVGSGMIMPVLTGLFDKPALIVYDQGDSDLLNGLAAGETFRIQRVDDLEELQAVVSEASEAVLGLVLPADFDSQAGDKGKIVLQGYLVHWATQEDQVELKSFFEEKFSQAAWTDVEIHVSERRLYPSVQPRGYTLMINTTLVVSLFTIGLALVPLLLIEEKEERTFEVLLVSPARYGQVIIGKAAAGFVYCLLSSLVVFFLAKRFLVNWPLAFWIVFLGAALAVGIGLLIGLVARSQASLSLWAGLVLLLLISTDFVLFFDIKDIPAFLQTIINLLPTSALNNLMNMAMTNQFFLDIFRNNSLILIFYAVLIYFLTYVIIRRSARR